MLFCFIMTLEKFEEKINKKDFIGFIINLFLSLFPARGAGQKLVENLALLIRLVPVELNAGDESEYDGARVTIDFVTDEGEPVRGEGTVEAVEGEKPVRVL